LNLLPLHAAWYHDEDGKRRYFCDDYDITYAPSIQVFDRCMARQATQRGQAQSLVALQNPSLAFAEWEIRETERHFSPDHCRRFGPAGIDKQAVVEALPSAEHLLFTTHGTFAPNNAEESGLEIDRSRGEYLTAREIVGLDLRRTRLAILSACESGMSEFHDPANEYLGLPAAVLLAGAHSVIASQWVVDDLSTALLVGRLHENLYECGMGTAAALRGAQRWLRTLTVSQVRDLLEAKEQSTANDARLSYLADDTEAPFANPYYWAAFFAFGAPGAGQP
jgi:CHAT domain-containing protein